MLVIVSVVESKNIIYVGPLVELLVLRYIPISICVEPIIFNKQQITVSYIRVADGEKVLE